MRRHGVRVAIYWIVLTVLLELCVAFLPIPAPIGSDEALGDHQTVYMLFYVAVPFFAFIWAMLIYVCTTFRRGPGDDTDGPPLTDSTPLLLIWAGISFTAVVFLAGWGTFTLHEVTQPDHGTPMHIQVIGQQWYWTYRYPAYDGAESTTLVLPVHQSIEFDITSMDVVHSLWIYDLDIKEDAVPGVVTHAFLYATKKAHSIPNGQNWVACNELCGLYHGYMRSRMRIVSKPGFKTWASRLEAHEKANGLLKNLPKYSPTYFPPPVYPAPPQDQAT